MESLSSIMSIIMLYLYIIYYVALIIGYKNILILICLVIPFLIMLFREANVKRGCTETYTNTAKDYKKEDEEEYEQIIEKTL